MKCKYCNREAMNGSVYCVLHEPFEGKSEEEKKKLAVLKKEQFLREIDEGAKDFRGIILRNMMIRDKTLEDVDFSNAVLEFIRFVNCTFKGVDFSDCKLSAVTFKSCGFEKSEDFSGVPFWKASLKELTFMDCDFSVGINFDSTEFKGRVSFSGTNFKEYVKFWNILTETCKEITLEDVTFKRKFRFSPKDNVVRCKLKFSSVVFKSDFGFYGITFEDDLTFSGVRFERSVEFRKCRFNGRVEFSALSKDKKTEFNDVKFEDCTFFNDLKFAGVDFKSNTRFINCDFVKRVLFVEFPIPDQNFEVKEDIPTQFGINGENVKVEFYNCTFQDLFNFRTKIGENVELNFSGSIFERPERVEFRNVNLSKASFLYVRGLEKVRFTNVTWNRTGKFIKRFCLYDEKLLAEGKIEKILKNLLRKLDEDRLEQEMELMEAIAQAYRQLRMAYESSLMYPEAGDFYIGEMEMKRLNAVFRKKPVENRLLRFLIQNFSLTAFYKYLSYYGECYWLPLLWMFLIILGFSGFYQHYYGLNWHQALENSFSAFFQMLPQTTKVPYLAIVLERLLGLIFMALFILALRRKFKKTEE